MADSIGAGTARTARKMGVTDQGAFLNSILEGSTEYSIVGKASAFILHDPDDRRLHDSTC